MEPMGTHKLAEVTRSGFVSGSCQHSAEGSEEASSVHGSGFGFKTSGFS